MSTQHLYERALGGDKAAIARLISLLESGQEILAQAPIAARKMSNSGFILGVTGPPGAGKSTLTDRLITKIRSLGQAVGVLAIDPSSPYSGGAILGDRVRMQDHALDAGVYIRSMAARGNLGGLSIAVPEVASLLELLGIPIVIVETVGVGQAEVEIACTADTTLVVVNPGWGDSIQANKAGLMEVADIFVINKADRDGLRATRRDIDSMLDLGGQKSWRPLIVETVASFGRGTEELWEAISTHKAYLEESGELERRRGSRRVKQYERHLALAVEEFITTEREIAANLVEEVRMGVVDPSTAARKSMELWLRDVAKRMQER